MVNPIYVYVHGNSIRESPAFAYGLNFRTDVLTEETLRDDDHNTPSHDFSTYSIPQLGNLYNS